MEQIAIRVECLLAEIPQDVLVVGAVKGRSLEAVQAARQAGLSHFGHNYVQEAEPMIEAMGEGVEWHLIGHLQSNKAKKAVRCFQVIETVDSWKIARILDRQCAAAGKVMPILVEINSGEEPNKTGVYPVDAVELVKRMGELPNLCLTGLMTMGPQFGDPEASRPYFVTTRRIFDQIAELELPGVDLRYLSMGMTNSFRIAIQEGANVIRIGTGIFGPRV